jgi:hypothetical protein
MAPYAATPVPFAAILERFPDTVPSDDALLHFLVVELNFLEPAARELVKSFRVSTEFVGHRATPEPRVISAEGNIQMPSPVVTSAGNVKVATTPPGTVRDDDGAYDDPIPIRLRGQRKAWVTLPKPFRESDKATLIAAEHHRRRRGSDSDSGKPPR